jgi:hypothetical protein
MVIRAFFGPQVSIQVPSAEMVMPSDRTKLNRMSLSATLATGSVKPSP